MIIDKLFEAVHEHCNHVAQQDDMTALWSSAFVEAVDVPGPFSLKAAKRFPYRSCPHSYQHSDTLLVFLKSPLPEFVSQLCRGIELRDCFRLKQKELAKQIGEN